MGDEHMEQELQGAINCALFQLHLVVVGQGSSGIASSLVETLSLGYDGIVVDHLEDLSEAAAYSKKLSASQHRILVPLVIITSEMADIDQAIQLLSGIEIFETSRFMLVTERDIHEDVALSLDEGRLVSVASTPYSADFMMVHTQAQIRRWFTEFCPDYDELDHILGTRKQQRELPSDDFLHRLELDGAELVELLLQEVERVLGTRPRLRLPEGVTLTQQGYAINAVYLVLKGSISLHRSSPRGDVLLHHASSGPLIGIVSLAENQLASFTSRSTTPVEVVKISIDQLEHILTQSPTTSALLAVLSIRALAKRLVRAEQLHVENELLVGELEIEKNRLSTALADLAAAREKLVSQARFAMLGELAAGIAHEINNPVAALTRGVSFLAEDVTSALGSVPQLDRAKIALQKAQIRQPTSTVEERRIIRLLTKEIGSRVLARRLLIAGIEDLAEAQQLLSEDEAWSLARAEAETGETDDLGPFEITEVGSRIGLSLRNVKVATDRIMGLVSSLRSYARPDSAPVEGCDLREGLEDTLRLLAYRLHNIKVVRIYGDIPQICCYPSRLGQVWTNLIANSVEAITSATNETKKSSKEGKDRKKAKGETFGKISIKTELVNKKKVRISITDDGPGIPPHLMASVGQPHFTTRSGQVRFGLGMGLSISQSIVEEHDGTMKITSRPGCTVIEVVLPIVGPAKYFED